MTNSNANKFIYDLTTGPLILGFLGALDAYVVSLKVFVPVIAVGVALYVGISLHMLWKKWKALSNVFETKLTLKEFESRLAGEEEVIERIDIDRLDPDNFTAVLLLLAQRKERRLNSFFKKKGAAKRPLHIVIVGRRFSSKMSPAVFNTATNHFELEVWTKGQKEIVHVPPKEFGKHVKQAKWEEECWDEEEEELLMGMNAADLRAFLKASGFKEGDDYVLYYGGVAQKAGLSCAVHSLEFEFVKDRHHLELTSAADLAKFNETWRLMTPVERKAHFEERVCAPSEAETTMLHLNAFTRYCNSEPNAAIKLYVASPLTAVAATFSNNAALAERVAYVAAMSGSWDGSMNLLGTCFNNAVDYDASKECFGEGMFPKARILMVPTETCKMGPFALSAETIKSLPGANNGMRQAMASSVEQWTGLKRGVPQALFDAVILLSLGDLVAHASIVPVEVTFGKNKYAEGTIYEDLGMGLENKAKNEEKIPGKLTADSPFPPGTYATEREFGPHCAAAFTDMISAALNAV